MQLLLSFFFFLKKPQNNKKTTPLNSIIYTWELLESTLSHKLPSLNSAVRKRPHKLASMGGVSGRGSVSWKAGGIQASSECACPHVTSRGEGISVPPETSPGVTVAPQTALVPLHFGSCKAGSDIWSKPRPPASQAIRAWPIKRPWSRSFRDIIVSLQG